MAEFQGGNVFPRDPPGGTPGITLRDYFAGLAMHAQIVASMNETVAQCLVEAAAATGLPLQEVHAMSAYKAADAMLREKEKKQR